MPDAAQSPVTTRRAYLSLGSNIAPFRHLPACLELLRAVPESRLVAESAWYRTAPWGIAEQPDFVNLAVAMDTDLSAVELLAATQDIETRLGRDARPVRPRNGPRNIDIDLLLVGEEVSTRTLLRLPHPGLLQRDFMLLPLLEIAPELRDPVSRRPLAQYVGRLPYRQILERLAPDETGGASDADSLQRIG